MAGQQAQVFLRSTDVGLATPTVIAFYPSTRPIDPGSHGTGMSVYYLDMDQIVAPPANSGQFPTLAQNWQANASSAPSVTMMAQQRIDAEFPVTERLASINHNLNCMQQYGLDPTKWPLEARQTKATYDEKWEYANAVMQKVHSLVGNTTLDVGSDKVWPTRKTPAPPIRMRPIPSLPLPRTM